MQAIMDTHEACRRAAGAGDSDAYYYENERFHFAIYQASHSQFLFEQCSALHRRLKPYRRLQLRVRNRVAKSFAEHEQVVAALLDGSEDAASRALHDDVAIQGERFSDFIASLSDARPRSCDCQFEIDRNRARGQVRLPPLLARRIVVEICGSQEARLVPSRICPALCLRQLRYWSGPVIPYR